jgi:TPR repeat protein
MSWSADFQKGSTAYQSSDCATALPEPTPLAKQGNAVAQYNLGHMYYNGQGVPQDYKTAVKWWKLAAEQGYARAQHNLGYMYGVGTGVIQDNVYAHMWWNIAASSGNKGAVTKGDIVAKRMTPSQLAKAKDLARECVRKKYKRCVIKKTQRKSHLPRVVLMKIRAGECVRKKYKGC